MDTISLKTWQEFRDFVFDDKWVVPTYWRGHKDPAWPLASSFERKILSLNGGHHKDASMIYPYDGRYSRGGKKIWAADFYQKYQDGYIEVFERAASGLRGANPKKLDRDEWWALGRHYGLITPLLDWTEKPFIAAFFAVSELRSDMNKGGSITFEGKEVAIYRLVHNESLEGDGLRVVRPLVEELGRMHGQRGLFTWLDSEDYFELEGFIDNTGREKLLTRIVLSDQSIMEALKDFEKYGIDYRSLFPDLPGAALHANAQVDWNLL